MLVSSKISEFILTSSLSFSFLEDLSFPPPHVVQHNVTPTVTIPPTTHTHSTHGITMSGASTSTSTVAEAPSCM